MCQEQGTTVIPQICETLQYLKLLLHFGAVFKCESVWKAVWDAFSEMKYSL